MEYLLGKRLNCFRVESGTLQTDFILDQFLDFLKETHTELYPAQEESILEIFSGKNVILNTPTGSGKSLVAVALHFYSLARQQRSIYTAPIKALVNEKFFSLCQLFGPENVGLSTGDASVHLHAPILCCTAEILANEALRLGEKAIIADIVMDEFHYYSDSERGMAWQIPLLTLPQSRFLLMSATMGNSAFFQESLTKLNQLETKVVQSRERPVPLYFDYVEVPLQTTVIHLIQSGKFPVYLVNFTQRQCAEQAQNFLSIDFCTKEEKNKIKTFLENFDFSSPYGKEVQKLLRHGIGIHHAGLLPKYKLLIETLAQQGCLKIICGTDTLGVGVNIPIKTVLFSQLCKFNGTKTTLLSVREFQQISGRAGRRGFDTEGYVIVQAPEYVIENLQLEEKKNKKSVKRKPPKVGFLPWNRETWIKLKDGTPEELQSHFKISHSLLLQMLSRDEENRCRAIQRLIQNCHEPLSHKKQLRKIAFQLFRSLLERNIVQLNPVRIHEDYQKDFSLNQTLCLYLLDTLVVLNQQDVNYVFDVLTLVESILEDPESILRKQLAKAKDRKIQELKAQGVPYEERQSELEKIEYPKPNQEFIYETFNHFAFHHPWIGQENIRPKSIAREMFETFQTFSEYVQEYQLQRSEGLLLRYLSDVYKTLVQTVPDRFKTEELNSMIEYFSVLIQEVDSSLLQAWKKLQNPQEFVVENKDASVKKDKKNFIVLIRNKVYFILKSFAAKDYLRASRFLTDYAGLPSDLETQFQAYYEGHSRIQTDTQARHPRHTVIKELVYESSWEVHQVLIDPEDCNDWELRFHVWIEESELKIKLLSIHSIEPYL